VEHRFSAIVRWLIAIVGGTGFMLLSAKYGFGILSSQRGLGILIMLFAWTFYTVVIFSEKKIFGKIFADPEKIDMDKALKMINALGAFDGELLGGSRGRMVRPRDVGRMRDGDGNRRLRCGTTMGRKGRRLLKDHSMLRLENCGISICGCRMDM